ncbi:MAG: exodeoxyribonuclease VII small subunit [Synergistaceae bacterium]|nr:exodeoxyribonuclease VII small subunit [Synergistaceae bacterium]
MNFVEKMTELEKILKDLEGGGEDSLSLDLALTEYERGIELVRECRAYLADAQRKISILSQDGELTPLGNGTKKDHEGRDDE